MNRASEKCGTPFKPPRKHVMVLPGQKREKGAEKTF